MPTIYLAGPIKGMSYEDARHGWRQIAADWLWHEQIDYTSPMRGKDALSGVEELDNDHDHVLSPLTTPKGVVARDRNDVMTCDLVLCNLAGAKAVSIGTMVELGWADAWRKPIVTILGDGDLHSHVFVRELSSFIVPTLEEALEVCKAVLIGGE